MVLMAIVDGAIRFARVNVGAYGCQSNGGTLNCQMWAITGNVGIPGNEVADALPRGAARQYGVAASHDLRPFDVAQPILARQVETMHPDPTVISDQAP